MTDITKFWIFLLDFEIKTVCVVGLVLFGVYCVTVKKLKVGQAQSVSKKEMFCALIFCIYVGMLLSGMLIDRQSDEKEWYMLTPFWSYMALYREWNIYLAIQIIVNVLVFVPWGILLPNIWAKAGRVNVLLLSILAFSASIEVIQFIGKRGLFEFDDMFHNVLGAFIGYGIWRGWKKIKNLRKDAA